MIKPALFSLLILPACLFAQSNRDSTFFKPRISGAADAYYRWNLDAPAGSFNNFTKFTNTQNAFAIGMASLKVVDTFENISGVINLGFGPRVNEYNYTDPDNSLLAALKEVYVSYAATRALRFTIGKWYKHLGYETVDAAVNPNYSTSYMFTYSPMSYTGVKADIRIARPLSLMVGLANPADITNISFSPTKTVIAGVHLALLNEKLNVKLGYQGYGGVSVPHLIAPGYYLYKSLNQYDAVVQFSPVEKLNLVYNFSAQHINDGSSKELVSNVAYITYQWKPSFSTTLRGESLKDINGVRIGTDVYAATLTGNITINRRLRFVPEIRVDHAADNIFQKSGAGSTRTTGTGLLAAIYSFGKW